MKNNPLKNRRLTLLFEFIKKGYTCSDNGIRVRALGWKNRRYVGANYQIIL